MPTDVETSRTKVAVIEDDRDLCDAILDALGSRGFLARGFGSAEESQGSGGALGFDVAVIDVNLPGEGGYSLASRWRLENPNIGIVMLSARADSEDRRAGYASGADLYLTKPASVSELIYAIDSVLRRRHPPNDVVQAGTFQLSVGNLILAMGEEQASVTRAEANLLAAFVRAKDQTLESWQIAEILSLGGDELKKSHIELQMSRLRKKMQSLHPEGSPIRALRLIGYRLVSPVVVTS